MMKSSEFKTYLEGLFPDINFYLGAIDKSKKQCVGIFQRGGGTPRIALGGIQNTSYAELPLSILVHWTENADACEEKANEIYASLLGSSNVFINGIRIIQIKMLDSSPVNINRDEKNICEMVIRLIIIYEREVM